MLTKEEKENIKMKYRLHSKDTGSPEVQIALLTARIDYISEHLKVHKKDYSARRGLLTLINRRRRLLNYLQRISPSRYTKLVESLGLKR